jgi:hypothetical protein
MCYNGRVMGPAQKDCRFIRQICFISEVISEVAQMFTGANYEAAEDGIPGQRLATMSLEGAPHGGGANVRLARSLGSLAPSASGSFGR